jgi:GT2 family glycosyltransferase
LAQGEFVALVDADDELTEDALFWVARAICEQPDIDMIFSDEDKIDESGRRFDPYFKSDWNPALMMSQNAFCHLGVFRRSIVQQVGGLREGYEGAQDYDLTLRCADATSKKRIKHIPRILYHWRVLPQSTASGVEAKPYAWEAGRRAIADHLQRNGIDGTVERRHEHYYQVVYSAPATWPLVSVILPTTMNGEVILNCLQTLLKETTYPNLEILLVVNKKDIASKADLEILADPRVRVLTYEVTPFNYAWVNNFAAKESKGEFLCFINDDIEVITPDWLERMVVRARMDDVGAIGGMLYYPNDHIQHAGIILGVGGVAGHVLHNQARGAPGYFSRGILEQDLSAVTAALMVMRREVFDQVGGFNDGFPCAFNDVDLCIRIRRGGWRILWTPTVEMRHHESLTFGHHAIGQSSDRFLRDVAALRQLWGTELDADRFYNPNLSLELGRTFDLAFPPRVALRQFV